MTKRGGALNLLAKVWNSRIKLVPKYESLNHQLNLGLWLKATVKKIDGTYTRILRWVKNVSWISHASNAVLYGQILKLSVTIRRRRLALAGHVSHHDEPAGSLIFWSPDELRRRGHEHSNRHSSKWYWAKHQQTKNSHWQINWTGNKTMSGHRIKRMHLSK